MVAIREHERQEIGSLRDVVVSAVSRSRKRGLSTDGVLAALVESAQRILAEDAPNEVGVELDA